ncbi:DHH family phosphoesterase [Haloarchaeobius iranensis]|uniref:RecJ-like exonuclease, contains DnaJ-type Zn finger domain n=1 Tax=Haloarchaeobius iranensis TaxID=996166 RepID=A0A1G9Z485_9EURY|nr:OB-fold nucleic acid binding domain-containing protein [Haloarchaeobius iranensis]SDN16298.1 RecJ-like exonuclease, contains DnaJ-type Zn finger domain [Haloarchaeobius iranensis]
MGNCIICGASVDGHICSSHEEDVVFTFEGNRANQLKPGRYYEGSVDGFAEFGVFVDIGTSVTGLLHRSELDRRLDSLDWDAGDSVYVQVTDIRDNGNVDLGWSIRQRESDFRGKLVQTPEGDEMPDEPDEEAAEPVAAGGNAAAKQKVRTPDADDAAPATTESDTTEEASSEGEAEGSDETAEAVDESEATDVADDEPSAAAETDDTEEHSELARSTVDSVTDLVGQVVRIEGEIISVRQTSGPTVFEVRDETGVVEVAAFEEAGVRAYPDVEVDDVVRLEGEVERHHDEVQIETEVLSTLEDEDAATVADRMDAALDEQADPGSVDLLADHDAVAAVADEIRDVATEIRRAVIQGRPVVVRHTATADGYVAGAAIERAVLPLVAAEHERQDAQYHFCERRPLDDTVYGMDAATDDVTNMLDARERHGEQLPLVLLVDLGSTLESREGYELLDVYGAECLVVDSGYPDETVVDDLDGIVDPHLAGDDVTDVTTSALAANVAAHVNDEVRDDLAHLPAVSYWQDTPEAYTDLASEAGFAEDDTDELREAVGLEAFYQSYKDKRELITDILFEEADGLAGHVSEQFRTKLDRELQTARRNLSTRSADGVEFAILDADAFSNRFDFPPTELLLDALHRSEATETDDDLVTLGLDEDELHVRSTSPIDVRTVGDEVAAQVDGGGVSVVGGRDGHVEFLAGERDAVLNAAVAEIANSFA